MELGSLFLVFSHLFLHRTGDILEADNETKAVHCFYQADQDPCIYEGTTVPNHLISIMKNVSNESYDEMNQGNITWAITDSVLALVPPTIWLLMPVSKLSQLTGKNLSSIVLSHPEDVALARQVTAAARTAVQQDDFIKSIIKKHFFSNDVLDVIGEATAAWNTDMIKSALAGNALLAHYPVYHLFTVPQSRKSKYIQYVFALVSSPDPSLWPQKPKYIQRTWSQLYYHYDYRDSDDVNKLRIHLPGFSVDQLKTITNIGSKMNVFSLLKQDFDVLQMQIIFDAYLEEHPLLKLKDSNNIPTRVLIKLSPIQLQQLPIFSLRFNKWQVPIRDFNYLCPFSTMKQITQIRIAEEYLNGNLRSMEGSEWRESIQVLGPLIYTLPLRDLIGYSHRGLSSHTLELIESQRLSFMQIYYLTGNGTVLQADRPSSMRSLSWMLKGLPTSNIKRIRSNLIGSSVLLNLLHNLPAENVPQLIAVLRHGVHLLGDYVGLEKLLTNPSMSGYFENLPSQHLRQISKGITVEFPHLKSVLRSVSKKLPVNILSHVIDVNRNNSWLWNGANRSTSDQIILDHAIRGLTCYDIITLETSEFTRVIDKYNIENNKIGNTFPKNLQYCCFEKVVEYLQMKAALTGMKPGKGLMASFEPGDIEAVGGYVLSALPISAISISAHRSQILREIGKLSVPELMLAMNDYQRSDIVKLAIDEFSQTETLDKKELFQLKNLILFLETNKIPLVQSSALKVVIELDFIDKRLCVDSKSRSLWSDNIIKSFGSTSNWTEGTLTSLGDLLLVVSDKYLSNVSKEAWMKAASSLQFHLDDPIEWWSQENMPFYKACMEMLRNETEKKKYINEVRKLIKWQLTSVQWQLDTVKNAEYFVGKSRPTTLNNKKMSQNFINSFFNSVPKKLTNESNGLNNSKLFTSTETMSSSRPTTFEVGTETTQNLKITTQNSSVENVITSNGVTAPGIFFDKHITTDQTANYYSSEESFKPSTGNPVTSSGTKSNSAANVIINTDTTAPGTFYFKDITTEQSANYYSSEELLKSSTSFTSTSMKRDCVKKKESGWSLINFFDMSDDDTSNCTPLDEQTEMDLHTTTESYNTDTTNFYISNPQDFITNHTTTSIVSENMWVTETTNFSSLSNQINGTSTKLTVDLNQEITTSLYLGNDSKVTDKNDGLPTIQSASNNNNNYVVTLKTETSTKELPPQFPFGMIFGRFIETPPSSLIRENNQLYVDESEKTLPANNFPNQFDQHKRESETHQLKFDFKPVSENYDVFAYEDEQGEPEYSDNLYVFGDDDNNNHFHDKSIVHNSYLNRRGLYKRQIDSAITSNELPHETKLQVSCDALRIVGSISELVLDDMLRNMRNIEIADCLDIFNKMDLSVANKKFLWPRINSELHLKGGLLQVVEYTHLNAITLNVSEPWMLESIHTFSRYLPDKNIITTLVNKIFINNDIEDFVAEDVAGLGNLLCNMKSEHRISILTKSINSSDISLAIPSLGRLDCSLECLKDVANFATNANNYGPTQEWDMYDMVSLGAIPAGLNSSDWFELVSNKNNALMGLQPSAAARMPLSHLQDVPPEKFRWMPVKTLRVIYDLYYSSLRTDQQVALQPLINLNLHTNVTNAFMPATGYSDSKDLRNCSSKQYKFNITFVFILVIYYSCINTL